MGFVLHTNSLVRIADTVAVCISTFRIRAIVLGVANLVTVTVVGSVSRTTIDTVTNLVAIGVVFCVLGTRIATLSSTRAWTLIAHLVLLAVLVVALTRLIAAAALTRKVLERPRVRATHRESALAILVLVVFRIERTLVFVCTLFILVHIILSVERTRIFILTNLILVRAYVTHGVF